jgi:hypothetical protein
MLIPLILTILIESLTLILMIKDQTPSTIFFYTILINLFTLPPANIVYYYYLPDLFVVECSVTITEWFLITWLFRLPYKKAMLISIIANGSSALFGVLLMLLWEKTNINRNFFRFYKFLNSKKKGFL